MRPYGSQWQRRMRREHPWRTAAVGCLCLMAILIPLGYLIGSHDPLVYGIVFPIMFSIVYGWAVHRENRRSSDEQARPDAS
jgi:hypothetical protein